MPQVQHFAIARFDADLDRVIGDSQLSTKRLSLGVIELIDADGRVGTGFFHRVAEPLPALAELTEMFRREFADRVVGADPFAWVNRSRLDPARGASPFHPGIEQAMWDLQGQFLGLALYRLLGGVDRRVPTYVSGLEFHLDDDAVTDFYGSASDAGFGAFKVKVGHPDVEWDLRRIRLVRGAVGPGCRLMADANEAWSPDEAIDRLRAYADAGIILDWIEDPCRRDDIEGLRAIANAVPDVPINAGEYLDLSGKRRLLEEGAVDILNVHASVTDALHAGWLAAEHGVPISVGNTNFEIGVHLAAALPDVRGFEYSFLSYNHLLETPVEFCGGVALAPDRPGHGLRMSDAARSEFWRPE